jgi:hypothetical protein
MPITAYTILIKKTGGVFASTAACNGADATVIANKYCLVPMADLRASPFSLVKDAVVQAQVSATNVIGENTASVANSAGAVIKTEPVQPPVVAVVTADTTDTQIKVSYSANSDGGSPITSLALYWNSAPGGTTFEPLTGYTVNSLDTSFTVSSGITKGATYKFKHKVRNIFDWSVFSTEVPIKAATKPNQVAPITTSIVGSDVRIDWDAPDNRGDAITDYTILIQTSTPGTFIADPVNCIGNSANVLAYTYCDIPLSKLRDGTFTGLS